MHNDLKKIFFINFTGLPYKWPLSAEHLPFFFRGHVNIYKNWPAIKKIRPRSNGQRSSSHEGVTIPGDRTSEYLYAYLFLGPDLENRGVRDGPHAWHVPDCCLQFFLDRDAIYGSFFSVLSRFSPPNSSLLFKDRHSVISLHFFLKKTKIWTPDK